MKMKEFDFDYVQKSLPDDIAIKIASSLQASDLASLGRCSRFWREICKSDCLWESLSKQRWSYPYLGLLKASSSSSSSSSFSIHHLGWRAFYGETHNFMACRALEAVRFVGESVEAGSVEVGDYLKAVENLSAAQLSFEDVEMLLFKPRLHPLLNLVGLHYCISWMKVPAESVRKALQRRKISDRRVRVKWWKLGRWFYGFRMRDESHSREVTLAGLVTGEEEEVLGVLWRGAVHEVLRVQISDADLADHSGNPWYCPTTQTQD